MRKLLSIVLLCSTTGLAAAQDDLKGIAFAQAPEQSVGECMGADATQTIACAVDKCVEGGAEKQDCAPVAWCFPANWSVDIFLQHNEGPHWHEYVCGLESREAAEAIAKVICDRNLRPWLMECQIAQIMDGEGVKQVEE